MFKTIRNAFKVKELRGKILYTFMMLVVIRFGCQLPIPGIETSFFANWFAKQTTDVFGFFNAMTGGSFSSMSIFALSITPYITSSIIIQLLTIAIPKLEEMQKDGEEVRKKIQIHPIYHCRTCAAGIKCHGNWFWTSGTSSGLQCMERDRSDHHYDNRKCTVNVDR